MERRCVAFMRIVPTPVDYFPSSSVTFGKSKGRVVTTLLRSRSGWEELVSIADCRLPIADLKN